MTDAEALLRITEPQTGEKWFGTAAPIPAPTWPPGKEFNNEGGQWFELGTRGDATIVGVSTFAGIDQFFERGPDGSYTWIVAPSPREAGRTVAAPEKNDPFTYDGHTYYDSLALPTSLPLPSGDILDATFDDTYGVPDVHERDWFDHRGETRSTAGEFGGFKIVRYESPAPFVWSEHYDVTAPTGLSYVNWYYLLHTPWGTEVALGYTPFGTLDDVKWSQSYPTRAPSATPGRPSTLVDLNDSECGGVWAHDHATVVQGLRDTDWVVAGASAQGRKVYLPTAGNRLLAAMYQTYAAHASMAGTKPLSQDEFVLNRALVAYKTPSTGSWVVYLNAELSARTGC
jgi:hypothetical protein